MDGVGLAWDMGNTATIAAEPGMGCRALLRSGPSVLSLKRREGEISLSWKVRNNLCEHGEEFAGPLTA